MVTQTSLHGLANQVGKSPRHWHLDWPPDLHFTYGRLLSRILRLPQPVFFHELDGEAIAGHLGVVATLLIGSSTFASSVMIKFSMLSCVAR
jgi:hypothetical protein